MMGKLLLNLHSFLGLSYADGKEDPIHFHRATHTSSYFTGSEDSIPFGKGRDWKTRKLKGFLDGDSRWNLKGFAIEVDGNGFQWESFFHFYGAMRAGNITGTAADTGLIPANPLSTVLAILTEFGIPF